MYKSRIVLSVLIGLGLTAMGWSQTQPPVGKPTPVSESVKLTSKASNAFACDMFRELAKDGAGTNMFFSPWSISSALAMTMEGARNDTAVELGQVLRLPKDLRQDGDRPWRLDPYHTGFADVQRRCTPPRDLVKEAATRKKIAQLREELATLNKKTQFQGDDSFLKANKVAAAINELQQHIDLFELNVANAIWGEKTYPFEPSFAESVAKHYGTGLVREADFINNFRGERAKINRWVEDQTKNKIKDIIPDLDPETARRVRMILVNAIYFKGYWIEPFKKEWTKDGPFTHADGSKTPTPLMHQHLLGRYAAFNADGSFFETPKFVKFDGKDRAYPDGHGFQIAELPYKGNKLAMTILVPRTPNGLAALEKKLTGEILARWLSRLELRNMQVKLPRFRMETDYELGKPLADLGMKKAFNQGAADFTGISKSRDPDDRLSISRVLHKAFVDVNEEGTEAAAATAVITVTPISGVIETFAPDFHADRPFLFLIREVETGAVLFMGRMTTPAK